MKAFETMKSVLGTYVNPRRIPSETKFYILMSPLNFKCIRIKQIPLKKIYLNLEKWVLGAYGSTLGDSFKDKILDLDEPYPKYLNI